MSFLSAGKEVERSFAKMFEHTLFSSKEEDMLDHWDVQVNWKVDVKGLKRRNRWDKEPDESIHWVEIKNVNGDNGWLYGKADYFAFEMIDYWVIVSKESLQDFIKKNTMKEYVDKPTVGKLYSRRGRKDVLTMVKSVDLMYIATTIKKKDGDTSNG
jgi:hypothetical protein